MSFKVVFLVCIALGLLFFLISAILLAQVSGGLKYVVLASTALLASGLIALAVNDRK